MANGSLDIECLVKDVADIEITSILQFLQNKISKNVDEELSEVSNLVLSLNINENAICDYDLIYYYYKIKELLDALQISENEVVRKLKNIKNEFTCNVCKKCVKINYQKGLLGNLQSHICNSTSAKGCNDVITGTVIYLKEYEMYQNIYYDDSIKEKLFFKQFISDRETIYLYTIHVLDDIILCLVCNCKVPGENNVIQHIAGQRHVKLLHSEYNNIIAYHSSFSKLKQKFQIMQTDFSLINGVQTKCEICKRAVQFTNLSNHLRGRCFEKKEGGCDVDSDTVLELKEYELYRAICYAENIKEQLFPKVTVSESGEIIYFYTVHFCCDISLCLVCDCEISGKNNILQHVIGQRHVDALKEQYHEVFAFHDSFSKLEPKDQIKQQDYSLVDNLKTKCEKCKQVILFTNLLRHCKTKCFKNKNGGCDISTDTVLELEEYELYRTIYYAENIEEQLFPKVTVSVSGEIIYLYTIHVFDDISLCLVCDCEISGRNNILQHVNGQRHVDALKEQYHEVFAYHDSFSKLEPKDQIKQRDYSPIDNLKTKCENCKQVILFTNLLRHCKTKCFKNKNGGCDISTDTVLELEEYHLYRALCYAENIKEQLFPKVTVSESGEIIYLYTVHVFDDKYLCLVCDCDIFGENNILQHVNGQRHVNALMEQYHEVFAFHDNFSKLEPKDQLKQQDYSPVDNLKTKCEKCKQVILFTNLLRHCKTKCFENENGGCDISTDTILELKEYELYRTICYAENIKDQLFPKVTVSERGEIIYLYTVHVFDDIILCLVCDCEISGKNNILQHVIGQRHVNALKDRYYDVFAYHDSFSKLEPKDQIKQQDYSLVDNLKTKCENCKQYILFTNLLKHCKTKCFENENDLQYGDNFVNYHHLIMITVYRDLLDWFVPIENVKYPILQNIESKVYCLACNCYVNQIISTHTDSSQHHKNLSVKSTLQTIKKYHEIWCVQPVHIQIEQVYFRRRDPKIMCTLCKESMAYDSHVLTNHAESTSHKKYLMKFTNRENHSSESGTSRSASVDPDKSAYNDQRSSNSVSPRSGSVETNRNTSSPSSSVSNNATRTVITATDDFNKKLPSETNSPVYCNNSDAAKVIPYDPSVFDELYADGLMHFTITIDNAKYPTIMNRRSSKHCLICSANVTTGVLLHANSDKHIESMNSQGRRELLKKFHDLWIGLPGTDQCKQAFFKIDDDLVCVLCKKRLAYDIKELKSHIDSWEHVQKQISPYANDDTNDIDKDLLRRDSYKDATTKLNEDNTVDDSVDLISPEKKLRPPMERTAPVPYSKEIMNELYSGELVHYYIAINSIRYPLIQNMGNYKRCLICNIDLITSVLFHINSTPHVQILGNPAKQLQLTKYHNFWLNFPLSEQCEQKHFEIGEKLTCAVCQQSFDHDPEILTSHIFSIGHQNASYLASQRGSTYDFVEDATAVEQDVKEEQAVSIKLDEKEKPVEVPAASLIPHESLSEVMIFKLYHKSVMETVYLNLTQYTLVVENAPYPYIQNRIDSLYCLICRGPIEEIPEHISSYRHLHRCSITDVVSILKKFHNLFILLPVAEQMAQIYFKPKRKKLCCLLCNRSCLYNKIEVVQHVNTEKHKSFVSDTIGVASNEQEMILTTKMYHTSVLNTIYWGLEQYVIRYHDKEYMCLQNRDDKKYCLVCRVFIDGLNHVDSTGHINSRCNSQNLQITHLYHKIFSSRVPEYQSQQIYFLTCYESMFCSLCKVEVPYIASDVQEHMDSNRHEELLRKVETARCKQASTISEDSLTKIYPENNPLVKIQMNGKNVECHYCLFCEKLIREDVKRHLETKKHNPNSVMSKLNLKAYLSFWSGMDQAYKRMQNVFLPSASYATFCLKCGMNVDYVKLVDHIDQFHRETKYCLKEKLVDDFNFPTITYGKNIWEMFFKHNVPQCNVIYNEKSYPVLQENDLGIHCLLCKTGIKKEPLDHLESNGHINLVAESQAKSDLIKYHSAWLNLNTRYQIHLFFFDNDCNMFRCIVCQKKMAKKKLKLHLDEVSHINNMALVQDHELDHGSPTPPNGSEIDMQAMLSEALADNGQELIADSMQDDSQSEAGSESFQDEVKEEPNDYPRDVLIKRARLPNETSDKFYCLYCEKTSIGLAHLMKKSHRNRLSKDDPSLHRRVKKFLVEWSAIDPLYQDMQRDFIPISPTITFCLKCGINLEYYRLADHLKCFHQEKQCGLKEKLDADFHGPLTQYSKYAYKMFFNDNVPQCNAIIDSTSYPVLQSTKGGTCCLMCKKYVCGDTLHHLQLPTHIKHSGEMARKKILSKYHKMWSALSFKDQQQLLFFNNCTTFTFYCELCNESIAKKKIKEHMDSDRHIVLCVSAMCPPIGGEVMQPKTNFDEEHDLMEYLYPTKINEFARNTNDLDVDIIQTASNNNFTCLVCLIETGDVVKHIAHVSHQTKLLNQIANIDPIRFFHAEWRKVDVQFTSLQNLFYPVEYTITFCTQCSLNVEYSRLNDHLRRCHGDEEVDFSKKLDSDFHCDSKKEYCPKVQKILYPDDIPQCNVIQGSISYPVIQTLDGNVRCLLCYKAVMNEIYHHLNSEEHIANAANVTLRKRLKNYHDTWLNGDEDFQMQQMYFERDGSSYYCKVCQIDMKTSDLREHIMSDAHNASLRKLLINERYSGKSNVFHDIEIMPHSDNASPTHSSEVYYISGSDDDSEDNPKFYPKEVLDELYPHYDKYNIVLENTLYPIFRNTIVGLKCMICRRNPNVSSIEQHLLLETHKAKMNDRPLQNKLKKFHEFWMGQDRIVQSHQKYFDRSKCIACRTEVDYDNICEHVSTETHEDNILRLASDPPVDPTATEEEESDRVSAAIVPSSLACDPDTYPVGSQKPNQKGTTTPVAKTSKNDTKGIATNGGTKKNSEHKFKKSVSQENSSNVLDKIPLRYSSQTKLLIIDNLNNIFCECCSKKLKNDVKSIKEHFDSVNHLKLSNVPKKKMKYYCEICIKHYSMESSWDNHLVDLTHMARCNNLGTVRKNNLTEYECLTCDMVIFGDDISLTRHKRAFLKKKPKELTLPKAVIYLFANRGHITQFAEILLTKAKEASQNQDKEREVCMALVKALKEVYPMCKAYPFGSRVTGLGYCDSDLDVFLDVGDMYYGNQKQEPMDQANIVNTVAKVLQKHKNIFCDINKVAGARTPIVQVYHKDSKIDCDISFRHGLSVENTAFISLCLDLQEILRPTMLYLKEWYAATNLNGLSSYALTMLMIFYLQTDGYLLSVKELKLINQDTSHIIDGWETIKYTISLQKMKEYVNKSDYNVIRLMENFFDCYSKFDFEKWVVCPLMGYLISKSQFNGNGTGLPTEMSRYTMKLYGPNAEYFRNLTPMCVQDPFDLSHNLTKACTKDMVKKFQGYCSLSKKHLSALN